MASKKKFTTPIGTALYPRINSADFKFKTEGIYSADIRIPFEEAKELLRALGEVEKEHTGSTSSSKFPDKTDMKSLWYFERDEEGTIDKNNVVLRLRAKNVIKNNGDLWDRRPAVFDSNLNRVDMSSTDAPKIGGGSKLRVSFEAECYTGKKGNGMRLVPKAVQLVSLVEYSSGEDPQDFGFSEEEGFSLVSKNNESDDDSSFF